MSDPDGSLGGGKGNFTVRDWRGRKVGVAEEVGVAEAWLASATPPPGYSVGGVRAFIPVVQKLTFEKIFPSAL